jgi:hypothetical protein
MAMKPDLSQREVRNHVAVLHEAAREAGRFAARHRLVATLTESYELLQVSADACARAGIAGRHEQVAYCLAVLCQKSHPLRSARHARQARVYGLEVGADDFAMRLEEWANTVARNLRDWAMTYEAILDEAARFETTTVTRLLSARSADDDVVALVADRLQGILASGPDLQDMTVARAIANDPTAGEYVFQVPLGRWINTSAHRSLAKATARFDALEIADDPVDESEEASQRARAAIYDSLVAQTASLATTRELLPEVIDWAERLEQKAAGLGLASTEDSVLLVRYRAELAYLTDDLRKEQRSFGAMLEYILLAMCSTPKRQLVAILSLRSDANPRVTQHIAQRMGAILEAGAPPTPALINKAARAPRELVPSSRVRTLARLRDDAQYRAAVMAQMTRVRDRIPTTTSDYASIAAVEGAPAVHGVGSTRGQALSELAAIDPAFGRAFRRYAQHQRQQSAPIKAYVADLAGDEDALASAIAEATIEQATGMEALLHALQDPRPATRSRAALQAQKQRVLDITPPIAAQLAVIAATDSDPKARAAGAKALEMLGLPAPVQRG